MTDIACWLSSTVETHRERVSNICLNRLAKTTLASAALDQIHGWGKCQEHSVYAAAVVRAKGEINHMSVLERPLREQVDMWKTIRASCKTFLFEVVEVDALPQPAPVQQFSSRHFRSFVCEAETGQPEQLLAQAPAWQHGCPQIMLLAPAPYATLLVEKVWTQFVLPEACEEVSGSTFLNIRWDLLGVGWADISRPPTYFIDHSLGTMYITAPMARRVADQLRVAASRLDPADDFDQEEYNALEEPVLTMGKLAAQVNPSLLGTLVRESGRSLSNLSKDHTMGLGVPFKVAYMIKVMLLCSMLRDASTLSDAISVSLRMVLPLCCGRTSKRWSGNKLSSGRIKGRCHGGGC